MSDEELNAKAAELMGWHVHQWNTACYYSGSLDPIKAKFEIFISDWNPCQNIAQAFMVQAEIERRGAAARVDFTRHLQLVSPVTTVEWSWWYANAPARARVEAAVAAVASPPEPQ